MIIEMLLNAIYGVMNTLMVFSIPQLPADVYTYIDHGFDYISAGAGILANYTPITYLGFLFAVILSADAALAVYNLVMWIIRKIPMLGVS